MYADHAVRVIQGRYRANLIERISQLTREKVNCSICHEPGDSFLCRNGHPICRICLNVRFMTHKHECCVCRDDNGFLPSPFTKQAELLCLRWKCPDCHESLRLKETLQHRVTCPERSVVCPVDGCGKTLSRSHFVAHVLQHTVRDYVMSRHRTVGVVHVGCGGEIVVVFPEQDWVLHVQIAAHQDGSGVWYTVQINTYGDHLRVTLENFDPIEGTVCEVTHMNMRPDVSNYNGISFSKIQARLQGMAYLHGGASSESFSPHTSSTCGVAIGKRAEAVSLLRDKTILPRPSSLTSPLTTVAMYDVVQMRTGSVLCLALTVASP